MKIRFFQDEILSLLFLSMNEKENVTMKDIHEFFDIFIHSKRNKFPNDTTIFEFYMPMSDDFNTLVFEENKDGSFKIKTSKNHSEQISKLNFIKKSAIESLKSKGKYNSILNDTVAIYNDKYIKNKQKTIKRNK